MAEDRRVLTVRLTKEVADRLEAEVERTGGLARNKIVEHALRRYLPPLPNASKKRKA